MSCANIPPVSAHRTSQALALSAMMDMISNGQAVQAAVVRGAGKAEIEALREQGRALHESYLDHMQSAATHVRNLIEP